MSQDQPKPPTPKGSAPPLKRPDVKPSQTTNQTIAQLQNFWQQLQPVLKSQSIKLLRGTIQTLERVVEKLEVEPPVPTAPVVSPSSEANDQQLASASTVTPEITDEVAQPLLETAEAEAIVDTTFNKTDVEEAEGTEAEAIAASTEASTPVDTGRAELPLPSRTPRQAQPVFSVSELLDRVRPALGTLQNWWTIAIAKIRDVLPASASEKLSDRALSGIVASILLLVLWTTSSLLPGKSPTVTSAPKPSPSPTVAPPELKAPDAQQPVVISPSPNGTVPSTPNATESPTPKGIESPTPSVKRSPTPTVEKSPKPKKAKEPSPPPLNLTPEQSLIAAIQDQVAEVTNQYAGGLVQSIQANFRQSRLIVKVAEDWYDLNPDRQDKLANDILHRAQELDFNKLEMTDAEGSLLARSPVVGPSMVILRRSSLSLQPD